MGILVGIGFDRKSSFSFPSGGFGENVTIFGVGISSSAHINNNKKDILISWKRTYTSVRTYTNCRKKVFNQFYCNKKEILFKLALQWSKYILVCQWYRNLQI